MYEEYENSEQKLPHLKIHVKMVKTGSVSLILQKVQEKLRTLKNRNSYSAQLTDNYLCSC